MEIVFPLLMTLLISLTAARCSIQLKVTVRLLIVQLRGQRKIPSTVDSTKDERIGVEASNTM